MTDIEKRSETEILKAEKDALATLAKIKSEKAKRAEKSQKALIANLDKIKKLVLESGVTGSIRFDVSEDGKSVLHKVLKARSSNGTGRKTNKNGKSKGNHLTAEIKNHLDKALANKKTRPVPAKDKAGFFTVDGMQVSGTALGQYVCLYAPTSSEIQKVFPELSIGQCNGIADRWERCAHKQIVEANLSQ